MKILFTGGSSFTGSRFIQELAVAGHAVTAIFRREADEYRDEPRRRRVIMASKVCRPVHGCSFGDEQFLALVAEGGWDLVCHHAADVTNYKSPNFDAIAAIANNSHNLLRVLEALAAAGCRRLLLSGSVFEGGEGAGPQGLPDFSPYGLSKALTFQVFRYYCTHIGIGLGKFVIPNPFGPYEEPRFTSYLIKNWIAGATPNCSAPLMSGTTSTCRYSPKSMPTLPSRYHRAALSGSIPAGTPKARVPSQSAWPRKCGPG